MHMIHSQYVCVNICFAQCSLHTYGLCDVNWQKQELRIEHCAKTNEAKFFIGSNNVLGCHFKSLTLLVVAVTVKLINPLVTYCSHDNFFTEHSIVGL